MKRGGHTPSKLGGAKPGRGAAGRQNPRPYGPITRAFNAVRQRWSSPRPPADASPSPALPSRGEGVKNPSPPLKGEREGPVAKRWDGEVGSSANQPGGVLPPALSARPAGGENKDSEKSFQRQFSNCPGT